MRYSLTYVSLALIGALQVQGSCVEGAREEILRGYTVEYSCDVYQQGTAHKPIASAEDCAKLCQGSGREVCSYGDAAKVCVVGEPGKAHKTSPGVIYMKHVEEDPFNPEDPEDPFQPTPEECDEQLRTCESDRAKYKPASVDCMFCFLNIGSQYEESRGLICSARSGQPKKGCGSEREEVLARVQYAYVMPNAVFKASNNNS